MRKHDVRKWLHAILDLLPVIIIPVFMVYSHRHTIDTYAITTPKYDSITMRQDIVDGKPYRDITSDTWILTDCDADKGGIGLLVDFRQDCEFAPVLENEIVLNDIYYFKLDYQTYPHSDVYLEYFGEEYIFPYDETGFVEFRAKAEIDTNFMFTTETSVETSFGLANLQLFNLTVMFGAGNEPTIEEFNALFPDEYYPVDSTASALYENGIQTYNETDIGSQMFYCLYNSVDKYFNMGNVFGLTGVYKWFEVNIFHAQAPLSMYVVWNIVLYEFVMDLLFLLYGLFMWFIDMVEKLMDKPLNSVR